MHRETVASRERDDPGPPRKQQRRQRQQQQQQSFIKASENEVIYFKKEILREDRIWGYNFWMTDVQKTLRWYSHLQVRVVRHRGESKRNGVHTLFWQEDSHEVSYELEGVILPLSRRRLGKNSCVRIDCFASTAETQNKALFVRSEDIQRRQLFLRRDQYSIAKAGLVTEEKERKEEQIIQSSSPVTMQTKQKNLQISRNRVKWIIKFIEDPFFLDLFQQRCQRSRSSYKWREIEEVNHQVHWRPEQDAEYWIHSSATQERILADSVYAIIMYQSMLKECVVKVVTRDNLCLERTRSNTPKHWGSWGLRSLVQFLGNGDQNCSCGTWTQLHQRVAIGRTRNCKDEKYMQKNHTRTTVRVRRPRRKYMKQAITSCIRQNSSNSLQMPTWYSKEYDGEVYTLKENDGEGEWYKRSPTNGHDNSRWSRTPMQNSTNASSRIRRRAYLGKPRRINLYIWWLVESKLVDQVLVREIKKEHKRSPKVLTL